MSVGWCKEGAGLSGLVMSSVWVSSCDHDTHTHTHTHLHTHKQWLTPWLSGIMSQTVYLTNKVLKQTGNVLEVAYCRSLSVSLLAAETVLSHMVHYVSVVLKPIITKLNKLFYYYKWIKLGTSLISCKCKDKLENRKPYW